jgi:DNA-binding GntR family transcriptional regulator
LNIEYQKYPHSMDSIVDHRQLHDLVAERLRTAILDGDLKPGEWLRQRQIAEELGVSPMPVREALRQLAAEGVVEHVPYRGARVVQFSPEDVADLYANRRHLESLAAKSAAKNITPGELDELRVLQVQMREEVALNRPSAYARLNRRFHRVIYNASQRDYLVRALDQIWSAFPTMMMSYFAQTTTETLAEREAEDLEQHAIIIAALERGDGEAAERFMSEHVEENLNELLGVLGTQQEPR